MPVNVNATFPIRDLLALAPEIVLAIWGMIVLAADLGPFRRLPSASRRRAVGAVALVGALVALAVALGPLITRFHGPGAGARGPLTVAAIGPGADTVRFFGTIADDLMTVSFNALLASLLALVVWLSSAWSFTEDWGEYYALMLWSAVGMMLLAAAEELLILFLALETMTICLYLITAFEKDRRRSVEGGLKYFVYGSVSSALFLFGLSLIYGLTGTTRFEAVRLALTPGSGGAIGLEGNVAGATAVLLLLVGFGFKVAAVPFHQWAPDAYEGAPAPVTAWVATGSKIASLAAMLKVLAHALGPWGTGSLGVSSPGWVGVVAILAAVSMTYGNFAALAQTNFKRMLAYSSIAHAGYILVGVAAVGYSVNHEAAAGAVLFYLVIYSFGTVGAFALAVWLARDGEGDRIDDLNGLGHRHPILAVCILLLMLSLIGMPPLAGFFGKLSMFMEALSESNPSGPVRLTMVWLVALGLLNSVVSAFYYVRVLKAMFLRRSSGAPLSAAPVSVGATIVLATAVSLGFGLDPAPLLNASRDAAVSMLTRGAPAAGTVAVTETGAAQDSPAGPDAWPPPVPRRIASPGP